MADATQPPNPPLSDPSETYDKLIELLKTKNDTSRFVGLAFLKSVLDNGQLAQDTDRIHIIWESLSPKFLKRLLRARENEKTSKSEARDMLNLSVSILHTLTNLLPGNDLKNKRLTAFLSPLIGTLLYSDEETTRLILKSLLTIVSYQEGAVEFIHVDDVTPLIEIATQDSLVLDVFTYAWMNASSVDSEVSSTQASVDEVIPTLLLVFKDTDAVTLIQSIGSFLPKLNPMALSDEPRWLVPLVSVVRKLVSKRPTSSGRAAYTNLAAALLQAFPAQCPILLFKNSATDTAESKPFSYLLVNLLLIDLRSSFPTLLAQLNSGNYALISQRLAAAFDILCSFIGFLVRGLDDDMPIPSFSMPPDLLLKLRKDIAETMSLTIEYLRERWDASIAGASGLHPSARAGTAATSEGSRLTLTWETMENSVTTDPLVLAGIRALSIWIREDENENLRNESAGLMDMLIELYKISSRNALDFRFPVLLALEAIMLSGTAVSGFLEQDGWQILSDDLHHMLAGLSISVTPNAQSVPSQEASRGLEIIRILLAVLDSESTNFPREEWMSSIAVVASMKLASNPKDLSVLELQIAGLQLASAIISKAASGVQKRYLTSIPALLGIANQIRPVLRGINNVAAAELIEQLDDAELELENLREVRY